MLVNKLYILIVKFQLLTNIHLEIYTQATKIATLVCMTKIKQQIQPLRNRAKALWP